MWDFQVIAPNGAKGHFVIDDVEDAGAIFAQFVDSLKANDPKPDEQMPAGVTVTQPQKQAQSRRG
jgi:hypothetical protein